MREYSIAAIPADGIGPEVIDAGLKVLQALSQKVGSFRLNVEVFPWGSDYYKKYGVMMPANGLELLCPFDAIYFGAVGAPDVPDHVTLWGLRLAICQGFDQYVNLRPTRILQGLSSPLRDCKPSDLDWAIVRENTEGEYSGQGGRAHRGFPEEVATETSIFTRRGVTRIMRFAFKLAQDRPRKLLTVVTKSNAQRHGMVFWDEIAAEVSKEFPGRHLGQNACRRYDHAHGRQTLQPRHHRRHESARRHSLRPGRCARRKPRNSAYSQPRPGAALSFHVRANSRSRVRHHWQGHRQSDRCVLDRRANVGTSRRKGCGHAIDARRGKRHGVRPPYA